MTASWPAVVVRSEPSPEAENADGSTETPLAAPVAFELMDNAYWFCPTSSDSALTPASAPLIAETTEASDPLPTDTFSAVRLPVLSPPASRLACTEP